MVIRWTLWIVFLSSLALSPRARADVILDWNALLIDAIRADNTAPNNAARNFAILHAATWDAVNSVSKTHQPYAFQLETPRDTSAEAAAVGAAKHVFVSLYPSFAAWADDFYKAWLASAKDQTGVNNGLLLGARVAALMLELRGFDGSATDVPYIPGSMPGDWQRTPPFFRPPLAPQWGYVEPFCLPAVDPFLPEPPPFLGSVEYASHLNEVKALGSRTSSVRTSEQTEIAFFWSDFSYTATPSGHWQQIAAFIAREKGHSILENARLFALLSLAQADASIVCWEAKYRHNLWRPITAIRRAAEDGNDATEADSAWTSLLSAPPFPSYTSGHSTFSKASAGVLSHFYNTDAITFSVRSDTLPGVTRTFSSFSDCVDEVGRSRIYGGIHFEFDNRVGKKTGQAIAEYVCANYLLPHSHLPEVRLDRISGRNPQLIVHGVIGVPYALQVSADLLEWDSISTNSATVGGISLGISDTAAARFFRALEVHPLQ